MNILSVLFICIPKDMKFFLGYGYLILKQAIHSVYYFQYILLLIWHSLKSPRKSVLLWDDQDQAGLWGSS